MKHMNLMAQFVMFLGMFLSMVGCDRPTAQRVNGGTDNSAASEVALGEADAQEGLVLVKNTLDTQAVTEDNLPTIIAFLKAADAKFDLYAVMGTQYQDVADKLLAQMEMSLSHSSALALAASGSYSGQSLLSILKQKLTTIGANVGYDVGSVGSAAVGSANSVASGIKQGSTTVASGVVSGVNQAAAMEKSAVKEGTAAGAAVAAEVTDSDDTVAADLAKNGAMVGGATINAVDTAIPATKVAVKTVLDATNAGVNQAATTIKNGTIYSIGTAYEQIFYHHMQMYVNGRIKKS